MVLLLLTLNRFHVYLTLNRFHICSYDTAMYKTRNTGTGNGMRGTRGIGGMLYSGECCQTCRWMSPNIPGNVAKYSGECHQSFWGMSPNIPGNVVKSSKHSGEYHQRFCGMHTTSWLSNLTVGCLSMFY